MAMSVRIVSNYPVVIQVSEQLDNLVSFLFRKSLPLRSRTQVWRFAATLKDED